MRLSQITEDDNLYNDLEDDDQFGEGCLYCGLDDTVTDVINFLGEPVCVDCIKDRPLKELIKFDETDALDNLSKAIHKKLSKNDLYDVEFTLVPSPREITAITRVPAKTDTYKRTDIAADILGRQITAAFNAMEKARRPLW